MPPQGDRGGADTTITPAASLGTDVLGIYNELPWTYRICKWIALVVGRYIAGKAIWWGFVYIAVWIWLASDRARQASHSRLFSVLLLLVLLAIQFGFAALYTRVAPKLWVRLLYGRQVFGPLGGPLTGVISLAVRLSSELTLTLRPDDEKVLNELNDLNLAAMQAQTHDAYVRLYKGQLSDADLDARWRDVWDNQLLQKQVDGMTVGEIYRSNRMPIGLMTEFNVIDTMFAPAYRLASVIILVLAYRALTNPAGVLLAVQASVALSFFLSSALYLLFAFDLAEIRILQLRTSVPAEIEQRMTKLVGSRIRPRITRTGRYIPILRDGLARLIAITSFETVALSLLPCLVSLVGAVIFTGASRSELVDWYRRLVLLFALIPFTLLAGHYVMFFFLGNLRHIAAAVASAIVGALLPPALTYLFVGRLPEGMGALLTSAVVAAVAALVTVTTTRIMGVATPHGAG